MALISVPLVNRLGDRGGESLSSDGEVCERVSKWPDLSRGDSSFRVLDRRQELATSLLGDSFAAPMVGWRLGGTTTAYEELLKVCSPNAYAPWTHPNRRKLAASDHVAHRLLIQLQQFSNVSNG
jgi:hypothetical protein